MDTGKEIKLNRRHSFRIYEQVDIFYQKIAINPDTREAMDFNTLPNPNDQAQSTATSFDSHLPDSLSKENDTLNANISASGISFTCKEELSPEDYLMIRILMLSGMTLIMTCCKVVYCKPSNPFEPDQYPYTIGVQFVNLRTEDKDLLTRYINKKRARQIIAWTFLAALTLTFLAIPEIFVDLVLELSDLLIDTFLEAIFLINDLISLNLDRTVEYFLHSDTYTTQLISFYIQSTCYAILGLYASLRIIPAFIKNFFYRLQVFYSRKKSSLIYYWSHQTILKKSGIIAVCLTVLICYGLFFI
jgi:PilZ domain-containing protein